MMTPRTMAKRYRGDFFGGLTAGIVALPLALAFGVASGAGPAAGLYGAVILGFFAALFGGTRTQISGPTGPMTVVTASAIAAFSGDMVSVFAVVMLAGIIQIGFGIGRIGGFVRYIPYPVISGFMNGIGVIIILLQLHPLVGAPSVGSPAASVFGLGHALSGTNMAALLLGVMTMGIVFLCPARVTRVVPSPLIALLAGTVAASVLDLAVPTIGAIPSTLPKPSIPWVGIGELGRLFGLGLALAVLGTIDSLLTSIVADSLTKTRHDSNRELMGQGVGNLVAGLFGGLPGAGATMRTVVNIKAGGSSRLSGVIHALFLMALLLGAGPLASRIPLAVLAGILVKVGVDILDYKLLRLFRKAPKLDLAVMLAVFGITVFVDLIVAVGVGVTLASFMITYRMARRMQIRIDEPPREEEDLDSDQAIQEETDFGIRVVSIRGPFFFGTAAQMQDKASALLGTRVVVINCLEAPFLDISAFFALSELVEKLGQAGVRPLVVADAATRQRLMSLGVGRFMKESDLYGEHDTALAAARRYLGAAREGDGQQNGPEPADG